MQEITIPVLVIASDGDRMVPLDVSWEMAKDIKESYFVSLKNCGHFQHIEQSGKVAGELVNFLSKI